MIKSSIFLILGLIFSLFSFGQNDYINYNLKSFQARKLNYENKLDSAVLLYQQAFNLVDYVHIENLRAGQKLAEKIKNDSLLAFCKNRIEDYSKDNNINTKYRSIIDSLSIEDQRVRRDNYGEAKYVYYESINDSTSNKESADFIKAKELMMEWWAVDSINMNTLLTLIKVNGFPSEKRVGKEAYGNAFIILLHFDKDEDNQILKPIIDKALIEGDIEPSDYAWIIDRRLSWGRQRKDPYYYQMPIGAEILSEGEVVEVNRRRKEIGLRKLFEGIEIKKDDMSISWKILY
ncbi:MAG: hypothetical protein COB15_13930 [Flavobacteriales bacterium]|nr:MAG: hypothetical protein COB15_13930 [Flavobacteriales bacterium]